MASSWVTQVITRQCRPSIVQHRGQAAGAELGQKEVQPHVVDAETFQRRLQHKVDVVEGDLPLYQRLRHLVVSRELPGAKTAMRWESQVDAPNPRWRLDHCCGA